MALSASASPSATASATVVSTDAVAEDAAANAAEIILNNPCLIEKIFKFQKVLFTRFFFL